jgi:abortive infection bacteriophage resistance protein
MKYDKPWLSLDKQLALAESRGLIIPDRDRAARWLKHIS